MRRFFPLLFVLVLLLPAQSAAAQSLTCQTSNGQRTSNQLTSELVAVGYGGPWDLSSLATAYANATGGSVSCDAFATAAIPVVPVQQAPTIVMVPGLDNGNGSDFATLSSSLRAAGLSKWVGFSYNEPVNTLWDPRETCQPIQQSEARLAAVVRSLRDSHSADSVILVGHSLGGVLAFDVAATNTDLTTGPKPFVRGVVTVDSPLGGISGLEKLGGWLLQTGSCPVLNDLRDRSLRGNVWQPWLTTSAQFLLGHGVHVALITNTEDGAVSPSEQGVDGAAVNYQWAYTDGFGLINHSAILKQPDGANQLANLLAGF